jgi:mannose-6-phosphate isomerase-like protein (cupin superfamily)
MDEKLLHRLQAITPEEQAILAGRTTIDRTLYMLEGKDRIHAEKLLEKGKLITLRTGTRFIDFPDHTHDYVEVVYMCAGSATHIVDGREIHLRQGELLLLSQRAVHAVRRAELFDVSVNFIVLPDFFNTTLSVLGREESPLRRFLVDCLCGEKTGPGYLHFGVSGVKTIENLVENLIYTLLEDKQNPEKTSQLTMALLFLQPTCSAR